MSDGEDSSKTCSAKGSEQQNESEVVGVLEGLIRGTSAILQE